jgi:hypothetical protein
MPAFLRLASMTRGLCLSEPRIAFLSFGGCRSSYAFWRLIGESAAAVRGLA